MSSPGLDYCGKGHDCHQNATCYNLDTKYTCQCNDGFKGDGKTCQGMSYRRQSALECYLHEETYLSDIYFLYLLWNIARKCLYYIKNVLRFNFSLTFSVAGSPIHNFGNASSTLCLILYFGVSQTQYCILSVVGNCVPVSLLSFHFNAYNPTARFILLYYVFLFLAVTP